MEEMLFWFIILHPPPRLSLMIDRFLIWEASIEVGLGGLLLWPSVLAFVVDYNHLALSGYCGNHFLWGSVGALADAC